MTRRNLLLATTTPPPTSGLQFPVYLVEGDNGQLGVDVFNYLTKNYPNSGVLNEEIYVGEWLMWYVRTGTSIHEMDDYVGWMGITLTSSGYVSYMSVN